MTQAKDQAPTDSSLAGQLVLLGELALLDQKGKVVSDKLETVPAAAKKASAAVQVIEKDVAAVQAQKEEADRKKKTIEQEINDEKAKIRKWENRANELRGEREHAALMSEVSTAKKVIRRAEDAQLEVMEAVEAADKSLAQLTPKLKKAQDEAKAEWERVEGDLKALRADGDRFAAARQVVLQKLPPNVVKRYEQVAAKRGGVGVALIQNGVCGGCRRQLPPQLVIQVKKGLALESCSGCLRLLVHESMTQAATPATTTEG